MRKREAAMGGGRKNLMRAVEEKILTLQPGHSIMQVLDLRGSNLIEVHLSRFGILSYLLCMPC